MTEKASVNRLADSPGDAVAVEDAAGQFVFVNDALCRILGYEPGELIGQPWTVLLPGQAEAVEGPGPWSEIHLRRKGGDAVPLGVTAWRLPIGNGTGQGRLSVFALGETQRWKPPAGRQRRHAGRDHRLASVVHELNNTLTIVNIQSQMMSRLEARSPRFGEHLAILQDQVAHMKRIVAELRMSPDLEGLQLETTDLNALIRHTLHVEGLQLRLARVRVIVDLEPDLPSIQADPHRLEQVLINLINNASQVLVGADPPRVLWVSTRLVVAGNGCPSAIQIRFTNNGPAIPRDLLSRIFEPFFTTKEAGQGTGLGLTICRRIVGQHGGRIWAESPDPNGAVFVVELPVEATKSAPSPSPPVACLPEADPASSPGSPGSGPYVLVVDGGPDEAHSVRRLLRQAGFDVALMPPGTHQVRCHCFAGDDADGDGGGSVACVTREDRS